MSRSVRFDRLGIHVAPSFPMGQGFVVDDLCPGVNLVHGPNGIGKSTTARAAVEIVAPGASGWRRPSLEAALTLEGDGGARETWTADVHAGEMTWRRDGRASEAPEFDGARIVHLPLESLLREADEHFAAAVARDSQGGFDLSRAGRELGWTAPARARTVVRALREARSVLATAQAEHQRIEGLDSTITACRAERARARAAAATAARLEAVVELRRLAGESEAIEARLAVMPEGMDRVRGDERSVLDGIAREHAELEAERSVAERQERRLQAQRERIGIADGLSAADAAGLRRLRAALDDAERARRGAVEARDELVARRANTANWTVADAPNEAKVDPARAPEFRSRARDLARAEARWRAEMKAIEAAPSMPVEAVVSTRVAWGATAALASVIVLNAVLGSAAWFWVLVVPVLLAWALLQGARRAGHRAIEQARRRSALAARRTELDETRAALEGDLGLALAADDAWIELLVRDWLAWREADDAVAQADGALAHCADRVDEARVDLAAAFASLGCVVDATTFDADAELDELLDRHARAAALAVEIERAGDRRHDVEARREALQQRRSDVYHRAGVNPGEDHALDQRLERVAEYRSLVRDLHGIRLAMTRGQGSVAGSDGEVAALLDRAVVSDEEIEKRLAAARGLAARVEELSGRLGRSEEAVERARSSHDVERALLHQRAAIDDLDAARESAIDSAVGQALIGAVRRDTLGTHRPAVFRRASEILVRITRGRLELELDEDAEVFAARDSVSGIVRHLDALSVGERVQVLVAVRLGFAEHESRGLRLPIVLDETLGTADDERSDALIDTVLELARGGHQVLSFTAQLGEVERWQSRLVSADVPYTVIDLAAVRGAARSARAPRLARPAPAPSVPAPDGRGREEYGRLLGVPGLDPEAGGVASVHLWHVVHDMTVLHELLRRGVVYWGPLQALRRHGGATDALLGAAGFARVNAAARVIERAFESWHVGRGRRIDRGVLVESKCVSDRFIEEVSMLATEVGGDPRAFITALEQPQRVTAWRRAKTDQLRSWLVDSGYLDDRPALGHDELRASMLAAAESDLARERIEPSFVDEVLDALA